jgi:hypothetical protein
MLCYTIYNENYFSDDHFSHIVCVLTWRACRRVELPVAIAKMSWIRFLDTPSCHECVAPLRGRRESPHGFASTRLVRTVGLCAQRRVASGHGHVERTAQSAELERWRSGHRASSEVRGKVCYLLCLACQ